AHHVRIAEQTGSGVAIEVFEHPRVRVRVVAADHRLRSQKKQRPHAIVKGTITRSPRCRFFTSGPASTISPMNSWPRISPPFIVGMKPSSRWRSEPQIAVSVTLTIASRGLRILGSGTRATRTSSVPYQHRAFMNRCPVHSVQCQFVVLGSCKLRTATTEN